MYLCIALNCKDPIKFYYYSNGVEGDDIAKCGLSSVIKNTSKYL